MFISFNHDLCVAFESSLPRCRLDSIGVADSDENSTFKRIYGNHPEGYFTAEYVRDPVMIWSDKPETATATCRPVVKAADTRVIVDAGSGLV